MKSYQRDLKKVLHVLDDLGLDFIIDENDIDKKMSTIINDNIVSLRENLSAFELNELKHKIDNLEQDFVFKRSDIGRSLQTILKLNIKNEDTLARHGYLKNYKKLRNAALLKELQLIKSKSDILEKEYGLNDGLEKDGVAIKFTRLITVLLSDIDNPGSRLIDDINILDNKQNALDIIDYVFEKIKSSPYIMKQYVDYVDIMLPFISNYSLIYYLNTDDEIREANKHIAAYTNKYGVDTQKDAAKIILLLDTIKAFNINVISNVYDLKSQYLSPENMYSLEDVKEELKNLKNSKIVFDVNDVGKNMKDVLISIKDILYENESKSIVDDLITSIGKLNIEITEDFIDKNIIDCLNSAGLSIYEDYNEEISL